MDALSELLSKRGVLLADGATGTNLFDRGLESGEAPELWCETRPDEIRDLHRSFVEAGSDIILTNSFGGTRHRLKLHGAENRVREINAAAARLAREVAEEAGRTVVVAGSVGPTGELLEPLGALTQEGATEAFVEQMEGLREGGVDVVWIETMSAEDEMRAAIEAARRLGLACVLTASFDTAGRTMMGLAPADLARVAEGTVAYGANCGVGASDILASLIEMDPAATLVVKGNCGIPQFRGTEIHYSGTPGQMADYARLAIDAGARIIGGCCGTTIEHLRAMREAIDGHERGPRPALSTITDRIGPLTNTPAATPSDKRPRRRRRAA